MVQHGVTWCRMVQDGARGCKMMQDGARWYKMVQDGARWCVMVKKNPLSSFWRPPLGKSQNNGYFMVYCEGEQWAFYIKNYTVLANILKKITHLRLRSGFLGSPRWRYRSSDDGSSMSISNSTNFANMITMTIKGKMMMMMGMMITWQRKTVTRRAVLAG